MRSARLAFLPSIVGVVFLAAFAAPTAPAGKRAVSSPLEFKSSLPALNQAFAWAKAQALAYVFTGDPVGDWYEAALPKREAFCMRDVSHQAAGANALGLAAINKNILRKFAANISESKDWCTYWEINRLDKPAPIDYRNDKEFWYNLPANFDVLNAIGRQYIWTGDRAYLDDPVFLNFYARTVKDYVERWALSPEKIMARPAVMNLAVPFDPKDPYRVSRGLASYNEDEEGLNVGADLPAAQYAAYESYAVLLGRRGDAAGAAVWEKKAADAKSFFHRTWWDPAAGRYFVFHSPDGRFGHGIGQEFLVYFGVTAEGAPTEQAIRETLERKDINIEMRSYYPEIFFRHGEDAAALRTILYLCDPSTKRREYPEVSFAVIGALARGLMGIEADARDGSVATRPRLTGELAEAEIKNVPVLDTAISVKHTGRARTEFHNAGPAAVVWRAGFPGGWDTIAVD
ncbi:MAG: hypothetical protein ABSA30_12265, partial [Candidatus Aminicenantales bacterium]